MGNISSIQDSIIEILLGISLFASEEGRKAIIYRCGFDKELNIQLDLGGGEEVFLTNLIRTLMDYGTLINGDDALTVFLETSQEFIGLDKKNNLEEIKIQWSNLKGKQKPFSNDIETYLISLVEKWNTYESPLIPDELRFSEIATSLPIIYRSSNNIRRGADEVITGGGDKDTKNAASIQQFVDKLPDTKNWIILGDPGSGKSTLLIQEAANLAQKAVEEDGDMIPVWIPLAPFGQQLERSSNYSLFDHLDSLGKGILLDSFGNDIKRQIRKGKVFFLFDGLDEIVETIQEQLSEIIKRVSSMGNRTIVTSRKVGFKGFDDFAFFEIAELPLDDQKEILLALCGEYKTQRILAEISARQDVRDLASVPMMLSVIALVARESDNFGPDYFRRNTDLFKHASKILLEGKHRKRRGVANPYNAEIILSKLSHILHKISEKSGGGEIFNGSDIEDTLKTLPHKLISAWKSPRHFLEDISETTNIIYPIDTLSERYKYLHRTFREFFSALEISKWETDERRQFVEKNLDNQVWAEVLVMLGGIVQDVNDYLRLLVNGPPDLALRTLKEIDSLDSELAAKVLQLRPMQLSARKEVFTQLTTKLPKEENLIDVLWAYLEASKDNIPRVDLYFIQEILQYVSTPISKELEGELFKHLPEVPDNLFAEIKINGELMDYWCSVEGGDCIIGAEPDDPEKKDWIVSSTKINVSPFDIGKVSITNKLYEVFDPSHNSIRDFQNLIPSNTLDDHPVAKISWYEAEIFCHWARQKFPKLRLPTEYEWEKASSWTGTEKRRFPWGNDWNPDLTNTWQKGPNRTTEVGKYRQGASPCGAYDMIGNVWEWCLNWFPDDVQEHQRYLIENQKDPTGPKNGTRRVDRGGGWYHDVGVPCTFLRAADYPGDIFSHCGFRVLKSDTHHDRGNDLFQNKNFEAINQLQKQLATLLNIFENKVDK